MKAEAARKSGGLVIVSSGGLTHGGGIGSITRMIHANSHALGRRVDVLDGRGEHQAGAVWSFVYVPWALLNLTILRLSQGASILHLQVSERSSFYRKGIFLAAARLLGMRTVLHHHGAEMIESYATASPLLRRTMARMVKSVDMNIALGAIWKDFLVNKLGAPDRKVRVVYNAGRDFLPLTTTEVRDPWHYLIAANLLPRKGIGELLQAVSLLAAQGAPVRLTLAGGGQIERYRQEAAALGILDRCDFTGWLQGPKAIGTLFGTHGGLVLPSHAEGMPIAIIEALGAHLPIVTTPVGSIPEILTDAVTCLMVDPGNASAIAHAMQRLSTDGPLRDSLIANGRSLYENLFSEAKYIDCLVEIYSGISNPVRMACGRSAPMKPNAKQDRKI